MNATLCKVIDKMIDLLIRCNCKTQAGWLQARKTELINTNEGSPEWTSVINELKRILGGMGSFTDIPLVPDVDSGMQAEKARQLQWKYANELDKAIEKSLED